MLDQATFSAVERMFPGIPTNYGEDYGDKEWHFQGSDGSVMTVYTRNESPRIGSSNPEDGNLLANFKRWLKSTTGQGGSTSTEYNPFA